MQPLIWGLLNLHRAFKKKTKEGELVVVVFLMRHGQWWVFVESITPSPNASEIEVPRGSAALRTTWLS